MAIISPAILANNLLSGPTKGAARFPLALIISCVLSQKKIISCVHYLGLPLAFARLLFFFEGMPVCLHVP
jgi:hypothetical protein